MNSEKNQTDFLAAEQLFEDAEKALEQGDATQAEKLLRQVVAKNPNFSYAYRLLAELVAASRRYTEAIRLLDQCIRNDDGYSYAYYLSAKCRYRSGDADTASRFLAKARALEPESRLYRHADTLIRGQIRRRHASPSVP